MNFDFMPELRWRFGYPIVIAGLFGFSIFLYRRFKKSGWL
jgi:magnesium transporter